MATAGQIRMRVCGIEAGVHRPSSRISRPGDLSARPRVCNGESLRGPCGVWEDVGGSIIISRGISAGRFVCCTVLGEFGCCLNRLIRVCEAGEIVVELSSRTSFIRSNKLE